MKRVGTVSAWLFLAAGAWAQDMDRLRVRQGEKIVERLCVLKSITCKEVKYSISTDGERMLSQTEDADNVEEILVSDSRKSVEFLQAEDEMDDGDFAAAEKAWLKAMEDLGSEPILRQIALYQRACCLYELERYDQAISAFRTLKTGIPDTFYLKQLYFDIFDCHLAKGDVAGAEKVIGELEAEGSRQSRPHWARQAKLLKAQVLENQNKFREALAIYNLFSRERGELGEESQLGELRCQSELKDYTALRTRADSIVRDWKKYSDRSRCAAYNAMGKVLREKEKDAKGALMAYLRGITEFQRHIIGTPEHEESLALSAICMDEYGVTLPEESKKEEYSDRARNLLRELQVRYPHSEWLAKVREVVEKKKR
jgi:tetratricopeptide (TPR) repeat protein